MWRADARMRDIQRTCSIEWNVQYFPSGVVVAAHGLRCDRTVGSETGSALESLRPGIRNEALSCAAVRELGIG